MGFNKVDVTALHENIRF